MQSISDFRQRYGSVFVTELYDGTIVPFRLLTLKEYFFFKEAFDRNLIAPSILEDEIWKKCIQDPILVEYSYKQKAGTITSVTTTIFNSSAPQTLDEFVYLLDQSRGKISNIYTESVDIICRAFPAYTPEDLFEMDIFTFMDRLAQAEQRLLAVGAITEPLSFSENDVANPKQKNRRKKPKAEKPKIDPIKLKEEYDKQYPDRQPSKPEKKRNLSHQIEMEEVAKSPDSTEGVTVISSEELAHNLNTDPTTDSPEERQMIEEAKKIYAEYLHPVKKGEKVKIKSTEERLAEAKKRMELNKEKLLKKHGKQQ